MKPLTSYETHREAILHCEWLGLFFARRGADDDARRVRSSILTMHFGGVTPREATHLAERVKAAAAAINAAIGARQPVEA